MQQQFIRFPSVQKMVGLGRTTIYERIKTGTFPRQIKLGRASVWVESEIQEWILRQIKRCRHSVAHQ